MISGSQLGILAFCEKLLGKGQKNIKKLWKIKFHNRGGGGAVSEGHFPLSSFFLVPNGLKINFSN